MIKILQTKESGQGLLETIFAIGVLLMASVAILTIAITSSTSQRESEVSIVANNLSKEGLEVVRHIRDSNWLAGKSWNDGIALGEVIVSKNSTSGQWELLSDYETDQLFIDENNFITHEVGPKPAIYQRNLTIRAVCLPTNGIEEISNQCSSDQQYIGVEVASRVSWRENGRARFVILYEILYDWK
jgi:hypothetical protein